MDIQSCNAIASASPHADLSLFDTPSFDSALPAPVVQPPRLDRKRRQQPAHDAHALPLLHHPTVAHDDQRAIPATPLEDLPACCDFMSDLWEELLSDGPSDCSGAGCEEDAQLFKLIMSGLENDIISIEPAAQHSATSSPSQRGFLYLDSKYGWRDNSTSDASRVPEYAGS